MTHALTLEYETPSECPSTPRVLVHDSAASHGLTQGPPSEEVLLCQPFRQRRTFCGQCVADLLVQSLPTRLRPYFFAFPLPTVADECGAALDFTLGGNAP